MGPTGPSEQSYRVGFGHFLCAKEKVAKPRTPAGHQKAYLEPFGSHLGAIWEPFRGKSAFPGMYIHWFGASSGLPCK